MRDLTRRLERLEETRGGRATAGARTVDLDSLTPEQRQLLESLTGDDLADMSRLSLPTLRVLASSRVEENFEPVD